MISLLSPCLALKANCCMHQRFYLSLYLITSFFLYSSVCCVLILKLNNWIYGTYNYQMFCLKYRHLLLSSDMSITCSSWSSHRKTDDEREFLVKWKDLSYDECTWEVETDISTFRPEIERYEMILSRRSKKFSNKSRNAIRDSKELKQKHKEFQHCDCSPEFISGDAMYLYNVDIMFLI